MYKLQTRHNSKPVFFPKMEALWPKPKEEMTELRMSPVAKLLNAPTLFSQPCPTPSPSEAGSECCPTVLSLVLEN